MTVDSLSPSGRKSIVGQHNSCSFNTTNGAQHVTVGCMYAYAHYSNKVTHPQPRITPTWHHIHTNEHRRPYISPTHVQILLTLESGVSIYGILSFSHPNCSKWPVNEPECSPMSLELWRWNWVRKSCVCVFVHYPRMWVIARIGPIMETHRNTGQWFSSGYLRTVSWNENSHSPNSIWGT